MNRRRKRRRSVVETHQPAAVDYQQELGLGDHLLEVALVLVSFEVNLAAVAGGRRGVLGQDAVVLERAQQPSAQLVRCEAERGHAAC